MRITECLSPEIFGPRRFGPTCLPACLPTHPSIHPSIHPFMHASIYLSIYSCISHLEHRVSMKRFVSLRFLNLRQTVGLLGRGMSLTKGHYLYRTTKTQNERRQTCMHDPCVRVGEDISCLRPRGHCDRQWVRITARNCNFTVLKSGFSQRERDYFLGFHRGHTVLYRTRLHSLHD
jgi:hypothetical protein